MLKSYWRPYDRMLISFFIFFILRLQVGVEDQTGRVLLPQLVRVSYARLNPAGAYILENGQNLYLWLGREVPSEFLMEVFGVATLDEVDSGMVWILFFLLFLHGLASSFSTHANTNASNNND